jgi:hypothetical protein
VRQYSGWLVGSIACFFFAIISSFLTVDGEATFVWPLVLIFFTGGVFFGVVFVKKMRSVQAGANVEKLVPIKPREFIELKAAPSSKTKVRTLSNAQHVAGLPISQGAECEILYNNEKFAFSGAGVKFNLPVRRVLDVAVKTDTEIQKAYVSSVGGAVGGAVLFGPLGAIIGGRSKQKKTKKVTYYFVLTYKKEDESIDYISFEIKERVHSAAVAAEKFFRSNMTAERQSINL